MPTAVLMAPSALDATPHSKSAHASALPQATSISSGFVALSNGRSEHMNRPTASSADVSHPERGRGVFATRDLSAGTVIDISPVLLFPADEYEQHGQHTQLDSYTFVWRRSKEGSEMALALGLGSLFNHDPIAPNVSYTLDHSSQVIRFTTARPAQKGEELCISYGAGRMWWEASEGESSRADSHNELDEDELLRLGQGLDEDWEADKGIATMQHINRHGLRNGHPVKPSASSSDHGPRDAALSTTPSLASTAQPRSAVAQGKQPERGRLWRLTEAIDPESAPLELLPAWVIDVEPRRTGAFVSFQQAFKKAVQAAGVCEDPQLIVRHLRTYRKTMLSPPAGAEASSAGHSRPAEKPRPILQGMICAQQNMPSKEMLLELLVRLGASSFTVNGGEPTPYLVDVPADPAPSRSRLADWTSYWPTNHQSRGNDCAGLQSSNASVPLIVDRMKDEQLWTPEALQWARSHLRKCVDLALEAKSKGQVPIAARVTLPFHLPPWRGGGVPRTTSSGTTHTSNSSSRAGEDSPRSDGATTCEEPQALRNAAAAAIAAADAAAVTSAPIEAAAHDTRIEERNPLKHAVTNVIKTVASIRSEREKERHKLLGHSLADTRTPSPTVAGARSTQEEVELGEEHRASALIAAAGGGGGGSGGNESPARVLYFLYPSPGAGGCCGAATGKLLGGRDGGPYAVHEQSGLNHRFEVWRWLGPLDEDATEEDSAKLKQELSIDGLEP
ncbi:hypothetical protein CBOM_06517 [Ceraceosorus bombacis]|uniref:SET domain-containing protein n=1 Tax=Ceraceosorus bombacis TaxID=401625 RepID=A0A0P1BKX3_9BASI|nr:hypothetical protein CBOM_06517 [Ceraceosorus bombacis]